MGIPRLLRMRRGLWRVDALLALGVLSAWLPSALWSAGPVEGAPLATREARAPSARHTPGPPPWSSVARTCSAFWPCPVTLPPPRSTEPVAAPGAGATGLALRAFDVVLWVHVPTGPDGIVLASKDPAHAERYFPTESEPDGEVAIRSVEVEPTVGRITVARGEETVTFVVPRRPAPEASVSRRIVRARPSPPHRDARAHGPGGAADAGARDVKLVPFHGPEGAVQGVRVTGLRPGCALERRGLRPGDVIEAVGGVPAQDVPQAQAALGSGEGASLRVRRGVGPGASIVELGG